MLPKISTAQVILNEILIDSPYIRDEYGEWIELFNNGSISVELANWKIGDNQDNFTLPNITLEPKEFLVLAYNKSFVNVSDCIEYGSKAKNLKLANGGDAVYLFDESGRLIDKYEWNSSKENISQGRYPDGLEWNKKLLPTPGKPNKLFRNVKIEVRLDNIIPLGVEQKIFRITIEKENCSIKDYVFVRYNISFDNETIKSNFEKEVGCRAYAESWIPEREGIYLICAEIANTSVKEAWKFDNYVCKNITVVRILSILEKPDSARFGDLKFIKIVFNTSYYKEEKIRFLVYGKRKRVVSDLKFKKITKFADCSGDLSVESNVTKNKTYFFSIPFFIYPNCDNYYKEGTYEIALRVCRPAWEKFLEYTFKLKISGKNEKLCPKQEIKTIVKFVKENVSIKKECCKVFYFDKEVRVGDELNIIVMLQNLQEKQKNFTIYSYVFKGRKLFSEGLRNGKWKKGWDANKQIISLSKGEKKTVVLTNRIKESVKPGKYKLRIRIKGVKDFTFPITVLPAANVSLKCKLENKTLGLEIKNNGERIKVVLVAIFHNKTFPLILEKNNKTTLNFKVLKKNSFTLLYKDKMLDSCYYEISEGKAKMFKRITGRFASRPFFNFFSRIVRILRSILGL